MKIAFSIYIFILSGILITFYACKKFEYKVPEVKTGTVTANFGSATCNNIIISDGGLNYTSRGIKWSANPDFTNENTMDKDMNYINYYGHHEDNPTLKYLLTGLNPGTTYYARAYATNKCGTGYGDIVTFTTHDYSGTTSDIEGNVYHTINIGSQVWMAENLKTTKYRNGDNIPNVTGDTAWKNLTTGAYCNYDNNPANSDTYGKLYNWYAVEDIRMIAPQGWHIPSESDWITLINYLGGNEVAGGKLKESGTLHWSTTDLTATNEVGFGALPGGGRVLYMQGIIESDLDNFVFYGNGSNGIWWTITDCSSNKADIAHIQSGSNYISVYCGLYIYYYYSFYSHYGYKSAGFSIRCVKD